MQDLHTWDRPGLALRRLAPPMLRSTRITHIILSACMLLVAILDMALGIALDTAPE